MSGIPPPSGQQATDPYTGEIAQILQYTGNGNSEYAVDRFLLFFKAAMQEDGPEFAQDIRVQEFCRTIRDTNKRLYRKITTYLRTVKGVYVPDWEAQLDTLPATGTARANLIRLADVEPENITWLWEPYLPLGKLALLQGDPGAGKTSLMLAVAAAITQGYSLPDAQGRVGPPHGKPANVLYLTAEDGLADTIRPRAGRAGADLTRLWAMDGWSDPQGNQHPWNFAHMAVLGNAIQEKEPVLVILDPLQAFLGKDVDINRTNEVRPLMAALHQLASQFHCTILAIRHLTKSPGGKAAYRGQGSIDFTAAARSVLFAGESPEDETKGVMAQDKNTFGRKGPSLVYGISDNGFAWYGTMQISADELAQAQPQKHQHQRKGAMEWLRDYLHSGPISAIAVTEAAKAVGISEATLRRAKQALGILSQKQGPHDWFWRLPSYESWERNDDPPF